MTRLGSTAGWRVLAAATVACSLVLAGCDTTPKDETSGKATEKLYEEARDEAANGNWERASKLYEKLEGRAAGTALAQQAQIDLAYAYYKTGEKALAIATLERFIRLHPSSPALDYAYYLQGLVNFNERLGLLSSFARQDLSERDQQASRDAYQSFRQLTTQFPDSKYAPDAQLRMNYIVSALAAYEVHVARYYYRRGAYVAAANRAQQSVQEFQRAPAGEEALYIMMLSYDKLALPQLRDDAKRVLTQNFPQSRYLEEGFVERSKPWWQIW
ncbi:outer membrane protein assembly factor BamD [Methylibium sp.]|uniref:outer membrane protein assembly factor BamD n=1 Tax=Methylibium sp. TaxID=2067992 RepID=UPI00286B32C5|nr:outer membrane protein assembly factor BamD [Methylibium sp.]